MNRTLTWLTMGVVATGIAGIGAMASGHSPITLLNGASSRTAQTVQPAAAATPAPSAPGGSAPEQAMAEQSTAEQSAGTRSDVEESTNGHSSAEKPKSKQSTSKESTSKESASKQSASGHSSAAEAKSERSVTSHPKARTSTPKARVTSAVQSEFPQAAILSAAPDTGDDWSVTLRLTDGRVGTVIVDGHLRVGTLILVTAPVAPSIAPGPAPTHW